MPDRETLIRSIKTGDIFHATAPNGASLVCLAIAIDDTTISARRLFVPEDYEFDRTTGLLRSTRHHCPIVSIAPLPPDIRDVRLRLDHRNRTSNNIEDAKLSRTEIDALCFIGKHYRDNPI